MKKTLLSLLSASILMGCSPQINEGVIIRKDHIPSHKSVFPLIIDSVIIPLPDVVPERYIFTIERRNKSTFSVSVSESTYKGYDIGRHYRLYE